LGIDGLDPRLAERLMSRGEMPRLRELIERSAHARLAAEPEQVPAIVWTTIATGRGPEAHGIQAPSARRIAGMRTPLAVDAPESRIGAALATATDLLRITRPQTPTDAFRSVKTFWNVASEKGLRVGVVNWWATWPAEAVNGYMVTDRALIRLEKGGALDREVHPERIAEALRPVVPSSQEDRALAIDTFALEAARTLAGREPPDLEVLYLPGLDILTTRRLGDAPATDLATLETQLEAVHAHYRFLDDALGRWTETAGPRDVLVLVGDPGRLARRGAERAEGLLLLAGGAIEATDLGSVTERDIAPTVLHLIGMPISKELPGRVVEGALAPEFRRSHPVRFVATYGRRPPARPAESALDPQVLEELKSLGYIK
jgi:hypothetical protein